MIQILNDQVLRQDADATTWHEMSGHTVTLVTRYGEEVHATSGVLREDRDQDYTLSHLGLDVSYVVREHERERFSFPGDINLVGVVHEQSDCELCGRLAQVQEAA